MPRSSTSATRTARRRSTSPLRAGAEVDIRDHKGRTPLAFAVEQQRVRDAVDMARLLVRAGADPDAADETGVTPRKRAAERFDVPSRAEVAAAFG